MKKTFCIVLAVFLVSVNLFAGGGQQQSPGSTAAPAAASAARDELVIIHGALGLTDLDPQGPAGTILVSVLNNVYDYLIVKTPTGYEPSLATSWERPDALTWIFHLRDDVVFHDGEKFNAETMKFTLDRARRPDLLAKSMASFHTIDRVEVVDTYTLRIVTNVEDPLLLNRLYLSAARAVPPAYINRIGDAQFALAPNGTGPYKFVRNEAGRDLYMEYSPTYWGPAPAIKKIHWRNVSEAGARMAELQSGNADIVDAVPFDLLTRLEQDPSLTILNSWSVRNVYLQFDCEVAPTDNKLIRQAIAHSIDIDSLINDLLQGNGRRMASYSVPEIAYHDPDLKPFPYDVNIAKQLVAQSGIPTPIPLTFDVSLGRVPMDKEICEAITAMMNDTGLFKVTLVVNETGVYTEKYQQRGVPRSIGQIILSTHGNPTGDPDFTLGRSFKYIEYPRDMVGSHQSNRDLDTRIKQAAAETDDAKRRVMNYEIQRIIKEESPRLYLYQQRSPWGVNARVNWTPNGEFIDAWKITWK